MARITQQVDPTQDPTYLGMSKGTDQIAGNKAGGGLLEGLNSILTSGVEGVTNYLTDTLEKDVRRGARKVQGEEFGVDEATNSVRQGKPPTNAKGSSDYSNSIFNDGDAGQGGPAGGDETTFGDGDSAAGPNPVGDKGGRGAPAGVAKLGNKVKSLQEAYDAGEASDSYYYGRMNAFLSQMKTQFPGFEKEADQYITNVLGVHPANALRSQLVKDLDATERAKNAATNADERYLASREKYLYPGFWAEWKSGKISTLQLKTLASMAEQQEHQITVASQRLALRKAQGEAVSDEAAKNATADLGYFVDQTIRQLSSPKQVADLLEKAKRVPDSLTPEDKQALQNWRFGLRQASQAAVDAVVSGRHPVDGSDLTGGTKESYDVLLGANPEKMNQIKAKAMAKIDNIDKMFDSKDYGLLHSAANTVKVLQDDRLKNLYSQDQNLLNIHAIRQIGGDNILNIASRDTDGLSAVVKASKDAILFKGGAGKSESLGTEYNNAIKSGVFNKNDQVVLHGKILNDALYGFLSPGSSPEIAANYAKSLFSKQNLNFLSTITPNNWTQVYNSMIQPASTEKAFKIGGETWQNYKTWSTLNFSNVFDYNLKQVNAILKTGDYVMNYDNENHQFIPDWTEQGKKNALQRMQQYGSTVKDPPKPILKEVTQLNSALKNFVPVLERDGTDVNTVLNGVFQGTAGFTIKEGQADNGEKPKPVKRQLTTPSDRLQRVLQGNKS